MSRRLSNRNLNNVKQACEYTRERKTCIPYKRLNSAENLAQKTNVMYNPKWVNGDFKNA